ncbi:hypothetical protein [Saccharopolyspora flava]|uniref:Uncharacterized protein n=1 Tax=Saccharopolyspora flava TaxID=95161 RepID=A0A1I6UZK1_9PSEU|nr:hypothetical protein [Saccharopolyspora flava]SFT06860.1 hypothetical protein SAMN05660874_05430 [Saccharopolyspora flava]
MSTNHEFVPASPAFVGRVRNTTRLVGALSVLAVGIVMIGIAVSGFMLLPVAPASAIFTVFMGWLAGAFAICSALSLASGSSCVNTGAFNLTFARRTRSTLLFLAVASILPSGIALLILVATGISSGGLSPAAAVCLVLVLCPFVVSMIDMMVGRRLLDPNKVVVGPYGTPQR